MAKIRIRIAQWLLRKDDYLLSFYNERHGGGVVLCEDDENDFLRKAVTQSMECRTTIRDFFLTVAAEYLKKHKDERLTFSKTIYNTD